MENLLEKEASDETRCAKTGRDMLKTKEVLGMKIKGESLVEKRGMREGIKENL